MNHPRQAIVTRYIGATNSRGSRIKAYCSRGSITIGYPHDKSGHECHIEAARALLARFAEEDGNGKSWGDIDAWIIGGMPEASRDSYCFVRA
jgi:hypothetical protein